MTAMRMTAQEFRNLQAGTKPAKPGRIRRVRTECDGQVFDSKLEARRYAELALLQRAGSISELRTQVPFPFSENGVHCFTYIADTVYRDTCGNEIVEDTKGTLTQIYKLKKRLIEARYGITIQEWPPRPAAKPRKRKVNP